MTDCALAELILAGCCGPSRDEIVTKPQPASRCPVLPVRAAQPVSPPWPPGASFAVSLAWSASAGAASVNAFHAPSGLGLRGRIERLKAAFSATWRETPRHVSRR